MFLLLLVTQLLVVNVFSGIRSKESQMLSYLVILLKVEVCCEINLFSLYGGRCVIVVQM